VEICLPGFVDPFYGYWGNCSTVSGSKGAWLDPIPARVDHSFWLSIWFARRLKFVSIDDDFLYVSQLRKQIQVPLTDIQHVKENFSASPKLITLTLNHPSEFGTKIVFVPTRLAFAALRSHPIVQEIENAVQRRRSAS